MIEMPPIPDFLIRRPDDPPAPKLKTSHIRFKHKRCPFHLPKSIEPTGVAMLKEIERQKKAKEKARKKCRRKRKGPLA